MADSDSYEATVANGTILSNNVVVPGANFCVGQNVSFTLGGLPTDGSVIATNFQWSFGGTYFNDSSNAVPGGSFPTSSPVPFVNSSLLTGNVATNWWVSGGAGEGTDPNIPQIIGSAFWLYLIAQIIHIRANTEK